MNQVNRTLYIPLYGKAFVSRSGIILRDETAERIWAAEEFPLKRRSRSRWLAYYMGMRSAVFDRWLREKLDENPDAVILHLGCGMDSRAERMGTRGRLWFDVDFPEVIAERRRYYQETDTYRMLCADIRDAAWLENVPKGAAAIIVMEGVSMYLRPEALKEAVSGWAVHFPHVHVLMDCYTTFAAKASRYKNPINDVGVTSVFGLDDPKSLAEGTGLSFLREHEMTPADLICQLKVPERAIFKRLYAGSLAKKMYRLYEYST